MKSCYTHRPGRDKGRSSYRPPGRRATRRHLPGTDLGRGTQPMGNSLSMGGEDNPTSFFPQMEAKGQVILFIQFKEELEQGTEQSEEGWKGFRVETVSTLTL